MRVAIKENKGESMANNKKRKAHRDSGTGRFVTEEYAKKHPKTTQSEQNPSPRKRKKK